MRISWKPISAALSAGALLFACGSPPRGFDSSDPVERFHAALDASRRNDPRAVPELIKLLESDDAAVRLGASRELERITGQTMGYHHAESQMQRDEAIRAWRDWYESGTRSVESPGELANPSRTSVDIGARGG